MYTNLNDILQWLDTNNVRNFCVFSATISDPVKGNKCVLNCADESDKETETYESKKNRFIYFFNADSGGEYYIKQMSKQSCCAQLPFLIQRGNSSNVGNVGYNGNELSNFVNSNYISKNEMELMLEKSKLEFEISQLKQKLEEAKKTRQSSLDRAIEKLTPLIGLIIQSKLGVNGTEIGKLTTDENMENNVLSEKEISLLREWKNKEKDFELLIENIVKMIDSKEYAMIKNALIS